MENWFEKLKLTELLQVASLFVAFLILAVFGQRKTWIATEVIMATVCGLAFTVFPKQILAIQTEGTLGDTEVALARIFGVTLMSSGVTWYRTRESRDGTVPITLMMSRVFSSSAFLMAQLFTYFLQNKNGKDKDSKTIVWSEQMIVMGIIPTFLWLLGNLFHLFRTHDFNTYPQHNIRLNNHLRLDAWFMLLIGAAYLAYPSQIVGFILKTGNKVALHVARTIGALYIGEGIISLQAPGFLHERDKKALFLTRIVSELSQASVLAVLYFFFGLVKLSGAAYLGAVAFPVLVNALVGFFAGGTTIYHIPTPKKKNDNKGE